MLHRHLTHQQLTLAAIDDVIARGKHADWAELRSKTAQFSRKSYACAVRASLIPMPNATTSGSTMPTDTLPEWEQLLSSAARLQRILPETVLVV